MSVRVSAGGRLHFGFCNLSLEHERLYGSLGVSLAEPRTVVVADRAESVVCDHPVAREYAERAVERLGVPGARVSVEAELPRHVGLGSGTQLALCVLAATARAHDADPRVRERAPELGRGGRSGVGVAGFESGGFVLDAGHPTERFTVDAPDPGSWTVPTVAARADVPDDWRFVLVLPDADAGRHGDAEESSMRSVVESADPGVAERIAGIVVRRVLPALRDGDRETFGRAVGDVGRLNGKWYADVQGGVYRPPAGELVAALRGSPSVTGVGQSSWGPAVYGVTDAGHADRARADGKRALDEAGVPGEVHVVAPDNAGAR